MTDAARQLASLPASMQEVAAIIGYDAALTIIKRWGGTRLYIHERMTAERPLARAIGVARASELAAIYGRDEIPVPRAARRLTALRNAAIRAAFAAGEQSAPRLARDHHLTERQIRYIIAGVDPLDSPQQDLL